MRGKAIAAVDEAQLRVAACRQAKLGAGGGAVGAAAFEQKRSPMGAAVGRGTDVVVQVRGGAGVGDEQIKPPVVVNVRHRDAAAITSRIHAVSRRFFFEQLSALVVKQLLFLIAAQALVSHGRPVARVGKIHAGAHHHGEDVRDVAVFSRRDPAVHDVEIEPAVIVIVEKFSAPTPSGVIGPGLARDIGEGKIAVVVPEEIALAHVVVGDVGNVDVEQAIVIVVAPIGVHSFLGVDSDGLLRCIGKCPVAVIDKEAVSAKIAGHVEVVVAVIVGIGVSEIERPAAQMDANLVGNLGEGAVPVIVKCGDTAAVVGGLKALGEKMGRFGLEDIQGLKVASHEQVHPAVLVVIKGDGGDGVAILVQARWLRYLAKLALAEVLEQLAVSEAHHVEVGPAIVVIIQPQRIGGGIGVIIPSGYSGLRCHVSKREVAIIVVKMIFAIGFGVGDVKVFPAIAVVVSHRRRRSEGGVTLHDIGIGILKGAIGVRRRHARRCGDILKKRAGTRRLGVTLRPEKQGARSEQNHKRQRISHRPVPP